MHSLLELLQHLLNSCLRPLSHWLAGWVATPLMKMVGWALRSRVEAPEIEEYISQWLRCSLILTACSYNAERVLFQLAPQANWSSATLLLRVMMVMKIVQAMRIQSKFALRYADMPKLPLNGWRTSWRAVGAYLRDAGKVVFCRHLSALSPTCAILAAMTGGALGWSYLGGAVAQYFVICMIVAYVDSVEKCNTRSHAPRGNAGSDAPRPTRSILSNVFRQ